VRLEWRHLYIFWIVMGLVQITWGIYWRLPPHRYLFSTVMVGLLFLAMRTATFRRLWLATRAPWWLKAGVSIAGVLTLYEWVRTW
jgi:hypothetical protein